MAQTYQTLVGAPPDPRSISKWKAWYRKLLNARIAYCKDFTRSIYYYVSSSTGSDSNDGLTKQTPFQTLAKVQTVLTASSGNIAFLFKRGDEWSETGGIVVSKPKVLLATYTNFAELLKFSIYWMLGDYSSKKPLFNRFTVKYAQGGWTNVTGDRWSRTEANALAWVRDQSDRLGIVYTKVSTTTLVTNTPLSFFYDGAGTTLHINSGTGVNPNTRNLEAVIDNAVTSGIDFATGCDGSAAVGIAVHGYDITKSAGAGQLYNLRVSAAGTDAALFYDCEAFYSTIHTCAQLSLGAGGFGTFVECKAGYTRYGGAGDGNESIFNSYSNTGDHESIFHNCQMTYGTLPSDDWVDATHIHKGSGMIAHTGNPGVGVCALIIAYGFVTKANKWGGQTGIQGWSDTPTATSITDVRAFNVNEVFEPNDRAGLLFVLSPTNTVQMGGKYYLKPNNSTTGALSTGTSFNGWAINCLIEFDMTHINEVFDPFGTNFAIWNNIGNQTTPHIYNCDIHVKNAAAAHFTMEYVNFFEPNDFCHDGEMKNTIIRSSNFTGGYLAYVGFNNRASQCTNNAYFGMTNTTLGQPRAYDLHTNKVALSANTVTGHPAVFNSEIYQEGTDLSITQDANDYPAITTASIGPYWEIPYNYGLNAEPKPSSVEDQPQILRPAEPVTGATFAYTFTEIPDIIVVDGIELPAISYTGTVNWTISGLVVTLIVAATMDIFGLKLKNKK